ncbi:hypothetical protein VNO78_34677 [Psophocarpus tetragonolobus]|uniref:Glycosyl-hydrolase family 116 N-terminal domain-containing protein n=1 Tax=Psophocarpus tetragonolobus TaxID=3891 RepID=A0AAN9NP83_PSOTE
MVEEGNSNSSNESDGLRAPCEVKIIYCHISLFDSVFLSPYTGRMVENGFVEEDDITAKSSINKVDPGKPAGLTWQRKLNNDGNGSSVISLSLKEMIHLAPIGYRLWRHCQEEAAKGRRGMIDPFAKRQVTFCHGVPLGGIGAGSIGRSFRGEFQRWQLFPVICEGKPVLANQFSVIYKNPDNNGMSLKFWVGCLSM